MRINEGFVLREVAGQFMAVATGEASKTFHGMVKLNRSAADIWQGVTKGLTKEEIVDEMLSKYDASKDVIEKDVDDIIKQMMDAGFIVE